MALTRRQREILDFIQGFIAQHGYSPSLEEIGANFRLSSVATVHKHVQRLVEKRLLTKGRNRSRSIEPTDVPLSPVPEVPLLGVVAAGAPIEAVQVAETTLVPGEVIHAALVVNSCAKGTICASIVVSPPTTLTGDDAHCCL